MFVSSIRWSTCAVKLLQVLINKYKLRKKLIFLVALMPPNLTDNVVIRAAF